MFELPSAKRLKRSEFFGDDIGRNVSADTEAQDEDQDDSIIPDYGFEYELVEHDTSTNLQSSIAVEETSAKEEETYQFNLFRPASKPNKTNHQDEQKASEAEPRGPPVFISIRSPSPLPTTATTDLTFQTTRPESYYFTSALTPSTLQSLKTSYATSAVTGTEVLLKSTTLRPGASLPWRIIHLPAHKKQILIHKPGSLTDPEIKLASSVITQDDAVQATRTRSRSRPSKKRRDLLKSKAERRQVLIDETKTKEEHEKEKRNRKNRERKVKRRAKERREREGRKGIEGAGGDSDSNGGDDDDEAVDSG